MLNGPLYRSEIAGETNLTPVTVSRIVRRLIDAGLVRETEVAGAVPPGEGPGRRAVPLDIAPEGGRVLGIDLSLGFQSVTLADLKNRTIESAELKFLSLADPGTVLDRVAQAGSRLIDRHVEDRDRLLGGVVAVAGHVEPESGRVPAAHYLGWTDVPLRERLSDLLDIPFGIANIMAALAMAEVRFGAAKGLENVLVFICGVRMGVGVVANGSPVLGRHFPAGAIGRAPVFGRGDSPVDLDSLASGLRILQRLNGTLEDVSAMSLTQQANLLEEAIRRDQAADPDVSEAMVEAGRALGRVAAQATFLTAPEAVVIAGPLARSPRFLETAVSTVADTVGPGNPVRIVPSAIMGPSGRGTATCGLAICEFLFERSPDLVALGASPA